MVENVCAMFAQGLRRACAGFAQSLRRVCAGGRGGGAGRLVDWHREAAGAGWLAGVLRVEASWAAGSPGREKVGWGSAHFVARRGGGHWQGYSALGGTAARRGKGGGYCAANVASGVGYMRAIT